MVARTHGSTGGQIASRCTGFANYLGPLASYIDVCLAFLGLCVDAGFASWLGPLASYNGVYLAFSGLHVDVGFLSTGEGEGINVVACACRPTRLSTGGVGTADVVLICILVDQFYSELKYTAIIYLV